MKKAAGLVAAVIASIVLCASAFARGLVPTALITAPRVTPDRELFLRVAERGVAEVRRRFWDSRRQWYRDHLDRQGRSGMPLAYLWSSFPLFETLDAIEIADPTPAHKSAVRAFVVGARRYWNPRVGGFAFYPGLRRERYTYFDDNGWYGIAFLDAYRATGDRADLVEADRAFRFITGPGWDPQTGGTWWNTHHDFVTAEPLAAAAFVGAGLYGITRDLTYLRAVDRLLAWADRNSWDASAGLYQRNPTDGTLMDYVQAMMIGAELELCRYARRPSACEKAEALADASLKTFPADLDWAPVPDAIYLRFLLDLYRHDGDRRLYNLAVRNARRALANAGSGDGLFLRSWSGTPIPGGLLRSEAGTLSLFAWLAAAPSPSG